MPRLAPGRIFSASPHITEGEPSGKNIWVSIPPEGVETLTLKDAQVRLGSTSLDEAFTEDTLLPDTRVFHWFDNEGFEYWLPVIELIRKVFIRSPEMARAIIMYDGWHELVKEFSLYGETLEISLTKHPQRGDIFYLSLIAAKPSLLKAWSSVANHLPRAGSGVSISLAWPFNEKVSIHATTKKKGSQYWIQELLDVYDIDIPYTTVVPSHPSYVNRIHEGERTQGSESVLEEHRETVVTSNNIARGSTGLKKSSSKMYIHIQTNLLSSFAEIQIEPEYNDKYEKSTISDPDATSSFRPKKVGEPEEVEGQLTDSISAEKNEVEQDVAGVSPKEAESCYPFGGNLKGFSKALKCAKKCLEGLERGEVELNWVVRERLLELPKSCGSRWFLKIDNEVDRSWCMARITFEDMDYYFVEVGRGNKKPKFSISTLLLVNIGNDTNPLEWIEKMIENNGHWDTKYFKSKGVRFDRLHHQYKTSSSWGAYLAVQVGFEIDCKEK